MTVLCTVFKCHFSVLQLVTVLCTVSNCHYRKLQMLTLLCNESKCHYHIFQLETALCTMSPSHNVTTNVLKLGVGLCTVSHKNVPKHDQTLCILLADCDLVTSLCTFLSSAHCTFRPWHFWPEQCSD